MSQGTPARMLRLLSLLQGRREWSGAELAERLGVTRRTVRRDVARLRALGYPVDGTAGTAGGYRLASGRDLPPLLLDDDEAVAVAVGLRTAARGSVAGIEETSVRALAKLEQVLPARLRQQVAAVGHATVPVIDTDVPRVEPGTLAMLAAACRDQEQVAFDYRRRDGATGRRRVEPHALVTMDGRWYLLGHDADRDGWRSFRVDRIAAPAPTRRRFAPRPVPGGDAAAYVAGTISAAPYGHVARVTVDAPAEVVTARVYALLPGRVVPVDDHSCIVRLGADSLDLVTQAVAALATLGVDVRLDGPPDLLAHVRAGGRRIARMAAPA